MKNINILFPNQLFKANPLLEIEGDILLVEEVLFFQHFKFHVQKLIRSRCMEINCAGGSCVRDVGVV